jgi:NADPH:quinone reductase-like Zn-dependent oxidoreductase
MRAYGTSQTSLDSLTLVDVAALPVGAGQVRVQVIAAAINPTDVNIILRAPFSGMLHARTNPLVPGYDFSGVVVEVGAGVADVKAGDEVFGFLPYASSTKQGSFSENVVVAANALGKKPARIDHATAAAAATCGLTALQALRDKAKLARGQKVLVLGAAGAVGSMAVRIAKHLGAHVTGVCSDYAVGFVQAAGADVVVDRAKEDALGKRHGPYDVVFDTTGTYAYAAAARVLSSSGTFVTTLPSPSFLVGKLMTLLGGRRCEFIPVQPVGADFAALAALLDGGLAVPLAARWPVRDVCKGLQQSKSGKNTGRLVVDVQDGF